MTERVVVDPQDAGVVPPEGTPLSVASNGSAPAGHLGPAVHPSRREQWRKRRRELVTASDAAAILGFDPRRKPSDVALEKLGMAEPRETEPMKWGKRLESAIAEGYADASGRAVRMAEPLVILEHPELRWLGATLDAETKLTELAPWSPLELKAGLQIRRWKKGEPPPLHVAIQVQIQIEVRAVAVGVAAGFASMFRPPLWADVPRNEAFLMRALPVLEEFHLLIQKRAFPSDAEWYSRDAVRRIWPTDNGQVVALPEEYVAIANELDVAREREREAKHQVKQLEKRLWIRIGDAVSGYLPDQSSVTLKGSWIKPKQCACGREYKRGYFRRVLRRFWPKHLRAAVRALARGER